MNDAVPEPALHPAGRAPDAERLADYALTREDGAAAAEEAGHVAGCAECRSVLAVLDSVRADLRAQAAPMPALVSRRIATALAAAGPAARGSGRHRAGEAEEFLAAWRRRRLRAISSAAAGLIILGGGGYLLADGIGSSVSDSTDSTAGSGGGSSGDSVFGAAGAGELPAYDRDSLRAAVGELLAASAGGPDTSAGGPESSGSGTGTDTTGAATSVEPDCAASLPVATGAALSITRAVYDARPAIVVLFADASDRVQVTVLSDCSEGPPTVLDEFTADR